MSDARLILHIGGVKCGSSALQTFLSATDLTEASGAPATYAALSNAGRLVSGAQIKRRAENSAHGYMASISPAQMRAKSEAELQDLGDQVRAKLAEGHSVILSNEGWMQESGHVFQSRLLDHIGVPFEAFAAIRPQVDYMNSSWWQWGAWSNVSLDAWVTQKADTGHWNRSLTQWRDHPLCATLHVAPLVSDIVKLFLDTFDLRRVTSDEDAAQLRSNVSLPGEILRLFQRHADLREPDKSAIDFVLAKHDLGHAKTPWVMRPDLCEKILHDAADDTRQMCSWLPPETRQQILDDPRWWDASFYASKPLEPSEPQPADAETADALCAELVRALFKVEMGR